MKRSLPSMIAGIALVIILGLYMVTYQVQSTEVAVLSTFGKSTESDVIKGAETPGLRWKWPWPIQSVASFDNRIQTTAIAGEESSTVDKKTVVVSTAVSWRIADPYQFSVRYRDLKTAENDLRAIVRNHQKTLISQYGLNNFVSTKAEELQFDKVEKDLLAGIEPDARKLYGIKVESVHIEKLALPSKVTESVFSAMKKERQALADRYTGEGNSEAERIKKEAEGIAKTILSFANLRAAEIVAEGQAAANETIKTLRKDEDLAIFLMKLENLEALLRERATLIMDAQQPPFDLILEAGAAPAAAAAPATRPADHSSAVSALVHEMTEEK